MTADFTTRQATTMISLLAISPDHIAYGGCIIGIILAALWIWHLRNAFERNIEMGRMPTGEISKFRGRLLVGWFVILVICVTLLIFKDTFILDAMQRMGWIS